MFSVCARVLREGKLTHSSSPIVENSDGSLKVLDASLQSLHVSLSKELCPINRARLDRSFCHAGKIGKRSKGIYRSVLIFDVTHIRTLMRLSVDVTFSDRGVLAMDASEQVCGLTLRQQACESFRALLQTLLGTSASGNQAVQQALDGRMGDVRSRSRCVCQAGDIESL